MSKINKFDGYFSDSDDEQEPTDISYEGPITLKIQQENNKYFKDLTDFLEKDPAFIMPPNDERTNIVDRHTLRGSQVVGRSYCIPDDRIRKFFKHLDICRRNKVLTMLFEKQQEYSGIMVDFDIYQTNNKSFVNEQVTSEIATAYIKMLAKYVNIVSPDRPVDDQFIYCVFTKKPKVLSVDGNKHKYKDGFHMVIPNIQIKREVKRFILAKCIEENVFTQILECIEPAEGYTREQFVDTNSSHVPVYFLGCSTKPSSPPYELFMVYKVKVYPTICENQGNIILIPDSSLKNSESNMLCYEFSVNYENETGVIKKRKYEVKEEYIQYLPVKKSEPDPKEEKMHGEFSIANIQDPEFNYIAKIVECLSIQRAIQYEEWFKVLCALANTSASYKSIAMEFSKKCPDKYNQASFEHFWEQALNGSSQKLTIGSIHYWAQLDNPARYEEVKKQSLFEMVYKKIFDAQLEGDLQHYDIAQILFKSLRHKYVYDQDDRMAWYEFVLDGEPCKPGQIYKWRREISRNAPMSLKRYMSEILPLLIKKVQDQLDRKIKSEQDESHLAFHTKIKKNLQISAQRLKNSGWKSHASIECEQVFNKVGFYRDLDKTEDILGVGNGVLKLGKQVELIQGAHDYPISMYTETIYKPFNPRDPMTKKLMITLRNLFPDDEPDTFDFVMHYLASGLDAKKKESLILFLIGNGSNGKSFLLELVKNTMGDYAKKMQISFLTSRPRDADTATPSLMQLKNSRYVYYSESSQCEILHAAKMKEITGNETLTGRHLHSQQESFNPVSVHIVTSNYDFEIHATDHGTWRRVKRGTMKIKFCKENVDEYDSKNPHERIADQSVGKEWPDKQEVKIAFLSILTYYYESLQHKYGGIVENVPHMNIKIETEAFRNRQDKINNFINSKLVKTDPDTITPMSKVVEIYSRWHELHWSGEKDYKKSLLLEFENSKINKLITKSIHGYYIKGHRVLDRNETPEDHEEYYAKDMDASNIDKYKFFEPAEQYHTRICTEFDLIQKKRKEIIKRENLISQMKYTNEAPMGQSQQKKVEEPVAFDESGFRKPPDTSEFAYSSESDEESTSSSESEEEN